jgi:hypothetical protein
MAPNGNPIKDGTRQPEALASATRSFVITPSDTAEITAQAIMLSADGTVRLELWLDEAPVDVFLRAGVAHPLAVKRVYATGTDAVTIIGLV